MLGLQGTSMMCQIANDNGYVQGDNISGDYFNVTYSSSTYTVTALQDCKVVKVFNSNLYDGETYTYSAGDTIGTVSAKTYVASTIGI